MTEELAARLADLERKFAAAEARAEARQAREMRIETKVDILVEAESRRQGREQAEKREHAENREDRDYWARWVQHFIPAGVWVGLLTLIATAWDWVRNGGQ